MAVYSIDREDGPVDMNKDQMSVLNDENLINRIVKYDKEKGLVIRKKSQEPIYTENISKEKFTREEVTQQLNMKTL